MPRRDVGPEKGPGTLSRSATRKLDLDIGAFRGLEGDSALRGLDPESPAFTFYPKRETFIEEALVTQIPVRDRELLLRWSMSRGTFLTSRSAMNWVMHSATTPTSGTPTAWPDFWKRKKRSAVKERRSLSATTTNRRGQAKVSSLGEPPRVGLPQSLAPTRNEPRL